MASGLRAKLNAIGAAAPRVEKKPPRPGGVACYGARVPLDLRLRALDSDGLRRIGWQGRVFDIEKCLFLDTETTGLSGGAGTVAFLVGVGYFDGDEMTVEQYLMRDYDEEAFVLSRVADRIRERGTLCTFNGSTFDLPLLEVRYTMQRMRSSQLPLASATGITVFCVPFFASIGHWKPTHECWWMQAGRPLYGIEFRRNGAWNG